MAPGVEAVNGLILDLTLAVTRSAGGLPWASLDTSAWTVLDTVPIVAGAAAFLCARRSRARRALLLSAAGSLSLVVLATPPSVLEPSRRLLTVFVMDVGQGDAILLMFPDGVAMLVDAGPASPAFDAGAKVVAPLLKRLGVDRLRYLVLTHSHADHVGGVTGVLRSVPADTVLLPVPMSPGRYDSPVSLLSAGTAFAPTPDARVYVLSPPPAQGRRDRSGGNNESLILRVVFGEFSVLLTGDGEAVLERPLVARYGRFIRSTVMKVAHHGSSSGSSGPFLREVQPELAIISVGRLNRFGHPSKEVVRRMEAMSIPVLRTDVEGCVMIRSDGRTWERVRWRP